MTYVHVVFYITVMPWLSTIPYDLARQLAALYERCVSTSDADRWGVIKEWQEGHDMLASDRFVSVRITVRPHNENNSD